MSDTKKVALVFGNSGGIGGDIYSQLKKKISKYTEFQEQLSPTAI
tara:strand:- start:185 stop:319 length:135 start_codon:yes stop_codon:yes gene_type:complete